MRESECTAGGGGEGGGGGGMEAGGVAGEGGDLFEPDEQMSRPNIFSI